VSRKVGLVDPEDLRELRARANEERKNLLVEVSEGKATIWQVIEAARNGKTEKAISVKQLLKASGMSRRDVDVIVETLRRISATDMPISKLRWFHDGRVSCDRVQMLREILDSSVNIENIRPWNEFPWCSTLA
jgi:hypothetical protein